MNRHLAVYFLLGLAVVAALFVLGLNDGRNVSMAQISVMPTWTFTPTSEPTPTPEGPTPTPEGNLPPSCWQAVPSADSLWPANRKFVPVDILGVTDPDGQPVAINVTGIWQDEPVGAGSPDGQGVWTSTAELRAERDGSGDGRVYHVYFTASDGVGGSCAGGVLVGVPDKPHGSAIDGGALYDSTLSY